MVELIFGGHDVIVRMKALDVFEAVGANSFVAPLVGCLGHHHEGVGPSSGARFVGFAVGWRSRRSVVCWGIWYVVGREESAVHCDENGVKDLASGGSWKSGWS